ncbi:MAG: porin family protein [Gammaproteobacteria bacterium]|nr:porin family protein [Gammaproteobacteria bacterium]
MNIASSILIMLSLFAASSAQAFDGKRTGLQIGLGVGMSSTVVDYASGDTVAGIQSNNIATSAQIGFGLNEYLSIHVGGIGASVNNGGDTQNFSTIVGVGATWYLARSAASLYVTGLYGKGFLGGPDDERTIDTSAPAWMIGAGYELSSHLQVQASYANSGSTIEGQESSNDFRATYFTAKYVFY